uniref:Uncharacterized protein n=1 Tax=Anopheles stephensi TaxID=30069 RepID=A0A182YG75_ANOST
MTCLASDRVFFGKLLNSKAFCAGYTNAHPNIPPNGTIGDPILAHPNIRLIIDPTVDGINICTSSMRGINPSATNTPGCCGRIDGSNNCNSTVQTVSGDQIFRKDELVLNSEIVTEYNRYIITGWKENGSDSKQLQRYLLPTVD